jgi:hypothetical protein
MTKDVPSIPTNTEGELVGGGGCNMHPAWRKKQKALRQQALEKNSRAKCKASSHAFRSHCLTRWVVMLGIKNAPKHESLCCSAVWLLGKSEWFFYVKIENIDDQVYLS